MFQQFLNMGYRKTTTTTTTEKLRRETDTAAASQDTQDKGKSPKKLK